MLKNQVYALKCTNFKKSTVFAPKRDDNYLIVKIKK
nr:MAG TPA: hypothetical protein [Caudoviricetes sp.]